MADGGPSAVDPLLPSFLRFEHRSGAACSGGDQLLQDLLDDGDGVFVLPEPQDPPP